MKIGILDLEDEEFTRDVISGLREFETEFISPRQQMIPMQEDYKVIIDRLSFYNKYLREYVKYLSLNGTYVINNPFASDATNKIMDMNFCHELGIPCPKTIVLPQIDENQGFEVEEPDWDFVSGNIKFPCILKPYNGFAWDYVYTVDSLNGLRNLYDSMKSSHVLLVQEMIKYREYYRTFCINKKDVLFIKWEPKPGGMGKCMYSDLGPIRHVKDTLTEWTVELHSRLDIDLNVVEWCLDKKGTPFMIEAYNDIPDIIKGQIPKPYYEWIVEKMVECVKEKFLSDERNRTVFNTAINPKSFIKELSNNI